MRLVARWGVAVAVSAAGFALAWWVCQELIGLDEGVSLGVAGAVLAVLLAVAAWWAPRGADGGEADDSGGRLTQKARAGRDVYMAGRDHVTNTISGGNQYGPVLQGRDFNNLTFGAAPDPPVPPEDPDAG
jgi:hypothetical protein